MSRFIAMSVITISIRDLHARTGHFVRKAAEMQVIVTDNGRPIAEIAPTNASAGSGEVPYFARRKVRPGFQKLMARGVLRPERDNRSIDEMLGDVKADSAA